MAARVEGGRWRRWREPGIRGHQAAAGWLFLAPVIVILGLFLILPIVMALAFRAVEALRSVRGTSYAPT